MKIPLVLLLARRQLRLGRAPPGRYFHGTVYQVDTVYNFVDVIMPGGTKRFYAGPATIVRCAPEKALR